MLKHGIYYWLLALAWKIERTKLPPRPVTLEECPY